MSDNCCKDCPDRKVEPNCHTTCKKYQEFIKEKEKIKKAKKLFYEKINVRAKF